GSFDANRDIDLNHLPHQSNFDSYVEDSIQSGGKDQNKLLKMDDRRLGNETSKIHIVTRR
ncbi:hypothetical protein Ancab_018651, partial [Ancistrocladus abbreviatus]